MEGRTLLSFSAPVNYSAGSTPTQLITADFNGNGATDVVQLNQSAGTVGVSMGNGDGTFQPQITSVVGTSVRNMRVGDFNHDGKPDLVLNTGSTLVIEVGNVSGFLLPTISMDVGAIALGATANDVAVGDFNNDGFDDVATASYSYGGTTSIFLNDGTGHMEPPRNVAIDHLGDKVEVGDFNHDGNADLLETYGGSAAGIVYGHGDGSFDSIKSVDVGPVTPFSTNADVQIADVNKDGNPDIVSVAGSNVNVTLGNGDRTFQAPVTYTIDGFPRSMRIADLNGDGNLDIVTDGDRIMYGRGDGSFYAMTAGGIVGGDIAVADVNGDGAADLLATSLPGAQITGINVALNANNDQQLLAGATQLAVSGPATVNAGAPFSVTVTALDANGNVDTAFQGTVAVSGAAGTVPASYTFTAADNGVHTFVNGATLFKAGLQTYKATSPFLPDGTATINVQGGSVAKVGVSIQPTSVAGTAANFTVTATDLYGNPTSNYLGTVHFTSTDVLAGLPANYTFTAADAGVHSFSAVLKTAGAQVVTATDAATPSIAGASNSVVVAPSVAVSLAVAGGGGSIGSVNAVQISAQDAYGNVATGYNGVVHLASSDAASTTSADASLTDGVGTFTVTPMTLGAQTLTATDTASSLSGSETINVTPGAGVRFGVTGLTAATAGQTQNVTVTAYDAFGDVATGYTGYVAVATTDPRVPSTLVIFGPADGGVKTIPITLYTAGTQAVTISDYFNPAITFTQAGIGVAAAAASSYQLSPLRGTVAGVSQSFTVTARDPYGNVATNYAGTVNFSSSDAQASLPANYTFTAADAGTHAFTMAFKTAGGQTITVADTANPLGLTSSQRDVVITPAAMSGFKFTGTSISNTTAGANLAVTLSATDAYGNTVAGYTGTALLNSTDPLAPLAASYTFTAANAGSVTFNVALKTAGTQTLTATDNTNATLTGSVASAVKAAAMSRFAVVSSTAATAGAVQSVTVTATDTYGNAAAYTGTVHLSTTDAAAVLPANYTFGSKEGGTHTFTVTLNTPGTQSISVNDAVNTALNGSQGGITVTASNAPVASFSVTGATTATAGAVRTFTVTARDASGNIVTGYLGTVNFSSSDRQAGLPASYSFTAADNGSHTFSATLKTAGSQSITATDATGSTVVGSQSGIVVSPAAAAKFVVSAPTSVTQGVGFKFTMTVYDAYGNVATNYRGSVHVGSPTDTKAGNSNYTFSSSDAGVHVFSFTFNTLGSQTLNIFDSSNTSLSVNSVLNVVSK